MDSRFLRMYLVELVGTFGLVFFTMAVVCVNHLTTPANQQPATSTLTAYQPGLLGIAVAHGVAFTILLALTVRISGGYLNPAITLMLWVLGRLDTRKFAWFIGAQFLGAFLAGLCIRFMFAEDVLRQTHLLHFGTPHLSSEAYGRFLRWENLMAGAGVEAILTFFVVLAIFGVADGGACTGIACGAGGMMLAACVLVGFPLTGAATNPARWFGSMIWEWLSGAGFGRAASADLFVYIAGPIVGALLGGVCYFLVLAPLLPDTQTPPADASAQPKTKK